MASGWEDKSGSGTRDSGAGDQRRVERQPRPKKPGAVTRTSKLRPAPSQGDTVERQARAAGTGAAAPQVRSLWDITNDPWMDAAHRGTRPPDLAGETAVQAKGNAEAGEAACVHRAAASGAASEAIQRRADEEQGDAEEVDTPVGGINQPGFIDHDDGSNIRIRPAEMAGSRTLTSTPLPPTTRVFVSGHHPDTAEWLYVSAFLPDAIVHGYVQHFRVATDLPEPTAELYQIQSGDTAELLASRELSSSMQDGHDLRFYENVLLYVNRERGRTGITGSYQAPNILGGGSNNIQLIANRRIWLVSPAYAAALEDIVPDGSLTNGAVAGARRVFGHLEDILASVTDSPQYFTEVAGEYVQAIQEHLPAIIAITAGFILAEVASVSLAATPTGVGQLAALLIQLAIATFGLRFAAEAAGMALDYAQQWLTIAWTCNGDLDLRAEASRYFLRMLVQIAMAALAIAGVGGSTKNVVRIVDTIHIKLPTLRWSPDMVTTHGAIIAGRPVFTPGSIASSGPVAIGGTSMMSAPPAINGIASPSARANGLEHRAESARRAAEELPDDAPGKWDIVREARELEGEAAALRELASESTEAASALRAEMEALEAKLTAFESRIRTATPSTVPLASVPRPHLKPPANQLPTGGARPYEPPAQAGSPELVRARGGGYLDRYGNRWEWARDQHGGPHWDVQHPNGTHTNVYPDGMVHQGVDNFGR